MIRNPSLRAARQRLLFSPAAQQCVELPTDKQQELQTAVAELLLNAIVGETSTTESGETDDVSQAHA
jgi:anti-sigma regulatory factor (Ser/Thr protein kinase)